MQTIIIVTRTYHFGILKLLILGGDPSAGSPTDTL